MKVVSTVLAAKAKGSVISDSDWIAYVRNVAEPIWDKYLKSIKWNFVGFDLCIESHPLTYRKLRFLVKVPCDGKSGFQNILLALGVICQHITLNTWKTVMPLTFFSAKTSVYQCHNLPFDFTLLNNVWPKVVWFVTLQVSLYRKSMKFRFSGIQRLNSKFSKFSGLTDTVYWYLFEYIKLL